MKSCPECQGPLTPLRVQDADGSSELMDEVCETSGCDWEGVSVELGDAVVEP